MAAFEADCPGGRSSTGVSRAAAYHCEQTIKFLMGALKLIYLFVSSGASGLLLQGCPRFGKKQKEKRRQNAICIFHHTMGIY